MMEPPSREKVARVIRYARSYHRPHPLCRCGNVLPRAASLEGGRGRAGEGSGGVRGLPDCIGLGRCRRPGQAFAVEVQR